MNLTESIFLKKYRHRKVIINTNLFGHDNRRVKICYLDNLNSLLMYISARIKKGMQKNKSFNILKVKTLFGDLILHRPE